MNEAWQRELAWILHEYFPSHFQAIQEILKSCVSACSNKLDAFGFDAACPQLFPSATLVLSTVGTDVLKGFVTLEGQRIVKAEIQIQLPAWNKGNLLSLSLHPEYPVDLPQIHACSKLIELSSAALDLVLDCRDPFLICNFLDDSVSYAQEALTVIENVNQVYPMTAAKLVGCPDDLLISFGVQNCGIVATVSVDPAPGGTNVSFVRSLRPGSKSSLSSVFGSSQAECIVKVESAAPSLTAAHAMLVHCINKITMLRSSLSKLLDQRLFSQHT